MALLNVLVRLELYKVAQQFIPHPPTANQYCTYVSPNIDIDI